MPKTRTFEGNVNSDFARVGNVQCFKFANISELIMSLILIQKSIITSNQLNFIKWRIMTIKSSPLQCYGQLLKMKISLMIFGQNKLK